MTVVKKKTSANLSDIDTCNKEEKLYIEINDDM